MEPKPDFSRFTNLSNGEEQNTRFFFLESLLKARIDLDLETGHHRYDEEVNVYVAGLLEELATSDRFYRELPHVSPYDVDVRNYLEDHPGVATEFVVYKDNADRGLVATCVFQGHPHHGSYFARVMGDHDEAGRAALYYEMAGNALGHIEGTRDVRVCTLHSLSENIEEVVQIVRKVARDYFEFINHISKGSFFHLCRELDELHNHSRFSAKVDDFLKAYGEYRTAPNDETERELRRLAEELRALKPDFRFDPSTLEDPGSSPSPGNQTAGGNGNGLV